MRLLCTMLMSFTFSQVSWFQVSYFVELNRAMNYILYGDVENFARILGVCVEEFSGEICGSSQKNYRGFNWHFSLRPR